MSLGAIVLSTEVLLAWLIVAIGVLGFIVAHAIPKWYKAILPALLALALVAFGIYCVITITNKAKSDEPTEGEETGGVEPGAAGAREPPVRASPENLAGDLAAAIPLSDTNPFYFREDKILKVKVEIKNNGRKTVTSAKLTCTLPYRRNPSGGLRKAQEFRFDEPLEPGRETDVTFTFPNVANPGVFRSPTARIDEAH